MTQVSKCEPSQQEDATRSELDVSLELLRTFEFEATLKEGEYVDYQNRMRHWRVGLIMQIALGALKVVDASLVKQIEVPLLSP